MSADAILSRLDKVRETASNRWMAKCPAHEDSSPSLSIRELPEGRTLVYCFAGCAAEDVLEAVSLSWKDLYPPQDPRPTSSRAKPWHAHFNASELLETIDHEVTVTAIILADVLKNRSINRDQFSRLAQAGARIGKARDYCTPAEIQPNKTRYPNYGR